MRNTAALITTHSIALRAWVIRYQRWFYQSNTFSITIGVMKTD